VYIQKQGIKIMISFRDFYDMTNEGVIYPINITIDTLDVDILNSQSKYKLMNIKFFNDNLRYYKNGHIHIGVYDTNLKSLELILQHEIIHAIQDERSQSKFNNYKQSLINGLLKKYANNRLLDINKEKNKIVIITKFNNPYEKMAYAFMLVKEYKMLDIDDPSVESLLSIAKIQYKNIKQDKQFKKYVGIYYQGLKL
jgi:hypothetical protein